MFREAQQQTEKMHTAVYAELETYMEFLNKTASTWFDNDSASVSKRQQALQKAATLCKRLASFDDENADHLHSMGDDFYTQSSSLMGILAAVQEEEHIRDYDAPIFSSRDISDESKTGTISTNDWKLFMATEPSLFVESNNFVVGDYEEMRIRAFNYMEDTTSGHGLTRSAKITLTEQFLAHVEAERQNQNTKSVSKESSASISFPDAALFF